MRLAFGLWIAVSTASAAPFAYEVTLRADPATRLLHGHERIRSKHSSTALTLAKQAGLHIVKSTGAAKISETRVDVRTPSSTASFEYTAKEGPGFRWMSGGNGFFTAFDCEAWMICAPDPGSRATLRLEIIVPESSGLTAVGPGKLAKRWTKSGEIHFLYEQSEPVQTFLFSFAVSKLVPTRSGNLIAYAESAGHTAPLAITADAAAFFRGKTGVDAIAGGYTQVFVQQRGLAQESANLALMSEDYLRELEQKDDVLLLAHELAHQWWARLAGIRSWSDFWLNEGFAEFMSLAYLEHRKGRAAYQDGIAKLTSRMKELPDRPLHFEKWKTAREALGPVPYVKGALFLHRLRTALGDELFWRGLALYTRANAGTLVDSSDFQRAMEEASGRDLGAMFTEAGAVL